MGPLPAPHLLSSGEVQFRALARRGRQVNAPQTQVVLSQCPQAVGLQRGVLAIIALQGAPQPLQPYLVEVKSPGGQA